MARAEQLDGNQADANDVRKVIALDVAFDFTRLHETELSPPGIVFRIVDVRETRVGVSCGDGSTFQQAKSETRRA